MSAAASTSMVDFWAGWEGHVVNGEFPLRRYLGSSDHSGVFLTTSAKVGPHEVAIKIVAAAPAHAELQLSRWTGAAAVEHPNLVRIFEAGQFQVDGRPYLYVLMEYADQDLAQLLQRRALTEEEAREMLLPALTALGFLHANGLVQGGVKPSNVLVVGDQLKLASDTIRRVGDAFEGSAELSACEPPEIRETGRSAAADIWALGVTVCEALTRRQPLGLHDGGHIAFPMELPAVFRELSAWCLSRRPSDRPEVPELLASLRGERTVPVPILAVEPPAEVQTAGTEPASSARPDPTPAEPEWVEPEQAQPRAVDSTPPEPPRATRHPITLSVMSGAPPVQAAAPESVRSSPSAARMHEAASESKQPHGEDELQRRYMKWGASLAALLVIVLVGVKALNEPAADAPSAAIATAPVTGAPAPPVADNLADLNASSAPSETVDSTAEPAMPSSAEVAGDSDGSAAPSTDTDAPVLERVLPDVPASASRTIRGSVRVSVRVIVEQDGTVFAALAENPGPSRYFERLAIEAAKRWTFVPSQGEDQRLMLIRFVFTRDGTAAHATALP